MDYREVQKIEKERQVEIDKLKDELSVEETEVNSLSDGFFSVNGKYYFITFHCIDKYNEKRYIFRGFDFLKYLEDLKTNSLKDKEEYIDAFKLEVIESTTYKIKKIEI